MLTRELLLLLREPVSRPSSPHQRHQTSRELGIKIIFKKDHIKKDHIKKDHIKKDHVKKGHYQERSFSRNIIIIRQITSSSQNRWSVSSPHQRHQTGRELGRIIMIMIINMSIMIMIIIIIIMIMIINMSIEYESWSLPWIVIITIYDMIIAESCPNGWKSSKKRPIHGKGLEGGMKWIIIYCSLQMNIIPRTKVIRPTRRQSSCLQ